MQKIEIKKLPVSIKTRAQVLFVCAVFIFGLAYFVNSRAKLKIKEQAAIKSGVASFSQLSSKESILRAEYNAKQEQMRSSDATASILSKEDFITFVGNACTLTDSVLITLGGGNSVAMTSGMEEIGFQLEIEGTVDALNAFMQKLDGLKTVYRINNLSLRKLESFVWLDRNVGTNKATSWFDKNVLITGQPGSTGKETPLGVIDLYGSDNMRMYVDLIFVTIKNGGY